MRKISIDTGSHKSLIICGENWTEAGKYLHSSNIVIITDENVFHYYGKFFPPFPVITVKSGERSKKLKVIDHLTTELLKFGIDRSGFILAIGGGVVCDIAGFLGSVYMRGIRFGFISTSLLSQVDASIGGKNGVNSALSKNILGTFTQPGFVVCDPAMISTLPAREYLSGLSEIIKMGLILDNDLVTFMEQNRKGILKRERDLLDHIIFRSIELKASVVCADETETGKRMILNFGHTFGHVIETCGRQKHGIAVASGMSIAASISFKKKLLPGKQMQRVVSLLESYNLIRKYDIPVSKFEEMLSSDKKRKGDIINFVLLEEIGKASVQPITVNELISLYKTIKD